MTNHVLQSDIDLARRLLDAGRSDGEIVTALTFRNIDPDRAFRLAAELRHGLRVEPDLPEMGPLPRARPSVTHRDWRTEEQDYSARQPRGNVPWFMSTLLVALAICTGAVIFSSHRTHTKIRTAPTEADASSPGPEGGNVRAMARSPAAPKTISVEVRSDGLHLGSRLLNRSNALAMLADAFGPPSRTNLVEGSGTVMYAYDQQGLVIHCQKEKQNDCLVLYFDTIGGENGTRQPFGGSFRIAGHTIQGSTDPKTLVSYKELNLRDQGTNSVVEAQCHGVPVSFAYLETPTRLSLVQIELK